MLKRSYALILMLAVFLVNACGGVVPILSPTTTLPSYTATQISLTMTPTPELPRVELYKPSNIYDPKDPNLPELIIPSENGMRLDPNWQLSTLEYTYDWWGYSTEPVLGYERIERNGDLYYWNNREFSAEKIQEFLNSLSNLYPAESILIGIWHTDDYPTWQVDLTGTDGNHVLIYASSNENPGYGPWHVIYNGRIFADYQGKIGAAIGKLFDLNDEFSWHGGDLGDYHPNNLVGFETVGWTNQLWYGFDGLLPLSGRFHFFIDPDSKELRGYVRGRYSIGGFGNLVIGTVTSLRFVKLEIGNKSISCPIEKLESDDQYSEEWFFSCQLTELEVGDRYRIPIQVVFDTDTGNEFVTEGVVYGVIGNKNRYWILPPSGEIQLAINSNNEFRELLEYTVVYTSLYEGKMDLEKDASPILTGQIILLGEAEYKEEKIRYSLVTPFVTQDGKFLRFSLDDKIIKELIVDAMNSPVTKRFRVYYPDATINLWYSSWDNFETPQMSGLLSNIGGGGELGTVWGACGEGDEQSIPTSDLPLRMFSFNDEYLGNPWGVGLKLPDIRFILIDNQTYIEQINFSRWFGEKDKELELFWNILLPSQLNVSTIHPYLQIDYSIEKHSLRLTPPYYSTDEEFETYLKSLSLLPVPFQVKLLDDKAGKLYNYMVMDIDIIARDDGALAITPCLNLFSTLSGVSSHNNSLPEIITTQTPSGP